MSDPGKANRGPGAAAENRAALVRAAREVFAADGLGAPLSSVARRAGVGQGSLYRHFPDRISLALAVFDDNMVELDALAATGEASLDEVLAMLTRHVIASTAFVEMLGTAADDPRVAEVAARVEQIVAAALPAARTAGRVRADLETDDVLLAIGMLAGILARFPIDERADAAERAWALLDRAIRP